MTLMLLSFSIAQRGSRLVALTAIAALPRGGRSRLSSSAVRSRRILERCGRLRREGVDPRTYDCRLSECPRTRATAHARTGRRRRQSRIPPCQFFPEFPEQRVGGLPTDIIGPKRSSVRVRVFPDFANHTNSRTSYQRDRASQIRQTRPQNQGFPGLFSSTAFATICNSQGQPEQQTGASCTSMFSVN